MLTADVLIPVYRPGRQFTQLLERIKAQSHPVQRIILMNTEEACFPKELKERFSDVEIHHLTKEQFDHGGTRDQGIRK